MTRILEASMHTLQRYFLAICAAFALSSCGGDRTTTAPTTVKTMNGTSRLEEDPVDNYRRVLQPI